MADRRTYSGLRVRGLASLAPHLTLAVLALAAAAPIAFIAALVPRELVLAAFSIVAMTVAITIAAMAWWRNAARHSANVTSWDVAGVFMLIGCAAAIMTEPENLLQLFGYMQKN
jgi:hypothetical protein